MKQVIQKGPSVMGNRKTGDLSDRKAPGNQSQAAGGRYDTKALAEADTKKALTKMQQKKIQLRGKTSTGQVSDPVELNPERNIQGQGLN